MIKTKHNPVNYFAHIDGLRAIAVLSVVLHHLIPKFMPGGFIGVDIFFVISGYLITGILMREMQLNNFTFFGFYERRARRIFPALFTVLLFTLIGSYFLLLPSDLIYALKGTTGTLFLISNFVFWQDLEVGYFAAMNSALNPLVHTWSLAVEEQFYVLFPIMLLILHKLNPKNIPAIFFSLFLISLFSSEYFVRSKEVAVFFLLPFRAWELLAGSILVLKIWPPINSTLIRELISLLGLVAILFSCFAFSENITFPGLSALIPVLGSMGLIYAGKSNDGFILKLLKIRPFIFVGLISYSLYLWHWPLIVFTHYFFPDEPFSPIMIVLLFLGSIILASVSYYFIEQPFRDKKSFNKKFIFSSSSIVILIFSSFTIYGITEGGFNKRFSPEIIKLDQARLPNHTYKNCDNIPNSEKWCVIGKKLATKEVLLFGDSHLMSWAPVLNDVLTERSEKGILAMLSNCPPIIGITQWKKNTACPIKSKEVENFILQNKNINTVILAGYWSPYFKNNAPLKIRIKDENTKNKNISIAYEGLEYTISWLLEHDKEVVLIGPVPVYEYSVPFLIALGKSANRNYIQSDLNEQIKINGAFPQLVKNFLLTEKFHYIDPLSWICNPECLTLLNNESIYFDSNHLNVMGAMSFKANFHDEFKKTNSLPNNRLTL